MRTPRPGTSPGRHAMPRSPRHRLRPSHTSPRMSSVPPHMRSRPHAPPRLREAVRPQRDASAGGSAASSRTRSASSYLTTSGCGTTSAGRSSTPDQRPMTRRVVAALPPADPADDTRIQCGNGIGGVLSWTGACRAPRLTTTRAERRNHSSREWRRATWPRRARRSRAARATWPRRARVTARPAPRTAVRPAVAPLPEFR